MSKINPNKLLLSESFSSLQGEGFSTGIPSYFIRLATCNLHCGFSRKEINEATKTGEHPEPNSGWHGELHKEGKATWSCDSTAVWLKGEDTEFKTILDSWKKDGLYEKIARGDIHIIWTGGEPTIPQHQTSIVNFMKEFKFDCNIDRISYSPYLEIETNGTMEIKPELLDLLNQINCSAKLSNSGMSEKQRINPKGIKSIMSHPGYYFKFVISTEEDIKEIFDTYIEPFNIPLKRVYCMPGLDSQADFFERTNFTCEMAIKYGFIAGTRLHISAWNMVTSR